MINTMLEPFAKIFGQDAAPQAFFSPGRVNLIGEHTDHEGGFVFPCAIEFGIYALACKTSRNKLRLFSLNFDNDESKPFEISFDEICKKLTSRTWVNYPVGVASILIKHGYKFNSGIDILFAGNLPDGAGLSSSAAIEVLTTKIFSDLEGFNIDGVNAALFSQEAENNFVGMNCGIMDQFAVSMGKKDNAVLLNCSSLKYSYAPLELGDCKIIITNSNVPHSLVSSEYNLRRQQCEQALADLQKVKEISCLCDLTENELDEYSYLINDPINLRRARHAVSENARALRAYDSLKAGDLQTFGRLMNASHVSLRDNYQVTINELDILAKLAWDFPGVIGSRMTGGGFGGCTVSIVKDDSVKDFISSIGAKYKELTGRDAAFYETSSTNGAGSIK
ncbi:MAG: galactokinase [Synergistaceae bacterium]|nr:galactokinase [Synergistaceae bacterium]